MENKKAHSEEYFGDARDYWWNDDYLELMAKRLNLSNCKTMVDVGCGYGYMSYKLSPFLSKDAKIYGFDLESKHIENAIQRINKVSNSQNVEFNFCVGDANNIGLADNTADITVCQTVLIHVKDPHHVIREMIRVTKPGGYVVAIEPNNSINSMIIDSVTPNNITERLEILEARMIMEKGKSELGEGFNSIGDYIPQYFYEVGLKDTQVWLVDKACSFIPPYDTTEKKARVEEYLQWIEQGQSVFDYNEEMKYYIAGGGEKEKFERYWEKVKDNMLKVKNAIREEKYVAPGGTVFYLVAGRK